MLDMTESSEITLNAPTREEFDQLQAIVEQLRLASNNANQSRFNTERNLTMLADTVYGILESMTDEQQKAFINTWKERAFVAPTMTAVHSEVSQALLKKYVSTT